MMRVLVFGQTGQVATELARRQADTVDHNQADVRRVWTLIEVRRRLPSRLNQPVILHVAVRQW